MEERTEALLCLQAHDNLFDFCTHLWLVLDRLKFGSRRETKVRTGVADEAAISDCGSSYANIST